MLMAAIDPSAVSKVHRTKSTEVLLVPGPFLGGFLLQTVPYSTVASRVSVPPPQDYKALALSAQFRFPSSSFRMC